MTHYITAEGLEKLRQEQQVITQEKIPEALDAINRALAEGDVSENSALDAAKLERDKLEARLNEINEILSNYEIIEEPTKGSKIIRIGSTVRIKYVDKTTSYELKIVGASEADAVNGKISNDSPLAVAILGKKEGAEVQVRINPTTTIQVKIEEIIS